MPLAQRIVAVGSTATIRGASPLGCRLPLWNMCPLEQPFSLMRRLWDPFVVGGFRYNHLRVTRAQAIGLPLGIYQPSSLYLVLLSCAFLLRVER